MARDTMTCKQCGVPMNCHAEKPTDPQTADEARRAESGLGMVFEEIHRCPRCGDTQSRRMML
jgi:hypothetical protein